MNDDDNNKNTVDMRELDEAISDAKQDESTDKPEFTAGGLAPASEFAQMVAERNKKDAEDNSDEQSSSADEEGSSDEKKDEKVNHDINMDDPDDTQMKSEEIGEPEDQSSSDSEEASMEEASEEQSSEPAMTEVEENTESADSADQPTSGSTDTADMPTNGPADTAEPDNELKAQAKWYVVHTYAGHENKVLTTLKQRIESEHLENKIFDILVPTQDKIEIRSGKKEQVKEKIFPGYILVQMILDDIAWLAVRTTPGVTSFVGMGNKPTPIPAHEVKTIVQYMSQGAPATFKDVFMVDDTVKIVDGPFAEFIGKVDTVDKEKGKVRVLVSIFGRETPVELDFLQVQKL